jgi:hypothetical protein
MTVSPRARPAAAPGFGGASAVAAQPPVCAATHAWHRLLVPGTSPELLEQRRPTHSYILHAGSVRKVSAAWATRARVAMGGRVIHNEIYEAASE